MLKQRTLLSGNSCFESKFYPLGLIQAFVMPELEYPLL